MENSPQKSSFSAPAEFGSLRQKTLKQIEKDFALQGIEIQIEDNALPYDELVKILSKNIDDLELLGSSRIQPLLYQLDISEKFIREEVLAKVSEQQSTLLADAIVRRCFAKVIYRKKYS